MIYNQTFQVCFEVSFCSFLSSGSVSIFFFWWMKTKLKNAAVIDEMMSINQGCCQYGADFFFFLFSFSQEIGNWFSTKVPPPPRSAVQSVLWAWLQLSELWTRTLLSFLLAACTLIDTPLDAREHYNCIETLALKLCSLYTLSQMPWCSQRFHHPHPPGALNSLLLVSSTLLRVLSRRSHRLVSRRATAIETFSINVTRSMLITRCLSMLSSSGLK